MEFSKLTPKKFAARLKGANLMNKIDFDNKVISFNKRINSNKTKQLRSSKIIIMNYKLDYNFFIGRIYFISNDGSQNRFFLLANT